MAKGRQIYLQAEEIEQLSMLVEFRITDLHDVRQSDISHLSWAVRAARYKKPEPSDFNSLLPDPVGDYEAALQKWKDKRNYVQTLVQDIRQNRAKVEEMRSLLRKLYYYG